MSVVDTRVGTVLADYRIERLLGRGGMSSVYLAEHLRLHRKVALKLLAPDLAHDERFRDRFLRESQLAASLDHPNIVPIYDADEADGVLYIAMRWVDGTDLRELLHRHSPLDPRRAVAIVGQAAAGLDAAHRRGLVHRDVKPGNLLIGEDDHVYVSDFGLTKQASSQSGLTATGQLVGTVDYVAPEQIQGQPVDGRTDIYSLTCVLYEALVGAKPFDRDTEVATIWAHIQDPPPAPSALRPGLPKALDGVIAKGMAKRPEDRYATCRELVDAARHELGISSGEIPMPDAPPPRRVDRRVVVAGAVAVVAIAVVAVVLLTRGGSASIKSLPLNAVGAIDPKTNKLVASIPVGKVPVALTAGFGSIWVTNQDDGTVTRIDARTRTATDTIGVTGTPIAIAAGNDAVWVTTLEGHLFRLNPELNSISEVPIRFHGRIGGGNGFGAPYALNGVAAANGVVWVLWTGGAELLRYDPSLGSLVKIDDARSPESVALSKGAVWVSELNTVSRIDAVTNVVTGTAQVGALDTGTTTVAVGEGSVWVARSAGGQVWRVDPTTTSAAGSTSVGEGVAGVAAGEDGVWVARPDAGSVVRIDPRTGGVVRSIAVGRGAFALTTGSGLAWVATIRPGSARGLPLYTG